MKKLRFNNQWHEENIKRSGIRFGGKLHLLPFSDRTIKINISRKSYIFTSHVEESNAWTFKLPKITGEDFRFVLEITSMGYYILRADCDTPFRVNGTLSYFALIEKGDRVEFGLNQLIFLEEKVSSKKIDIPKNVVESNLSILLEGETGTGKSRMAKLIHKASGRTGRFVHLNLSAFSKNLFESELFGHRKGAFTGAMNDKSGAILDAHKGTLFIDEVDSLPEELQVKLLLFLDSRSVRPVGSNLERTVDVRLIFASGQNLKNLMLNNHIRKDFFYRLSSGFIKQLKPLRNNPKEICNFLNEYEVTNDVKISLQLKNLYKTCPWPGNFRQLKAHLDFKRVISKSRSIEMTFEDEQLLDLQPLDLDASEEFLSFREMKRRYFNLVFSQCGHHYNRAAKVLEVSPTTLREVLSKVA